MKGKRHTIEEKIRMLRKADGSRTVLDFCGKCRISQETFCRWTKESGLVEVNRVGRFKMLTGSTSLPGETTSRRL